MYNCPWEKTERNLLVLELRKAGKPLKEIAKELGISRNRVVQILARWRKQLKQQEQPK